MLDPAEPAPQPAPDLAPGEAVVLRSIRARLEGLQALDEIRAQFQRPYDTMAADLAFSAFEPWFLVLFHHCRRDLYLHRPCCPCLSEDECEMLNLIGHLQAGDTGGARRLAASLIHDRALVPFLAASLTLAEALSRLGVRLPRRRPTPATGHALH